MSRKQLIIFEPLPKYVTKDQLIATLRADITDAANKGKQRIEDRMTAIRVFGWEADGDMEVSLQGDTVIVKQWVKR